MKIIKLTKGKEVIVDDADYQWLNQWKWYFDSTGYAVRREYIRGTGKKNQKSVTIRMHRLINSTPEGMETDHINKNRLDNRRINLRSVTDQQNKFNMNTRRDNKSGVRGVVWDRENKKWKASIQVAYKSINLGRYLSINEARLVREEAERKYHAIA